MNTLGEGRGPRGANTGQSNKVVTQNFYRGKDMNIPSLVYVSVLFSKGQTVFSDCLLAHLRFETAVVSPVSANRNLTLNFSFQQFEN